MGRCYLELFCIPICYEGPKLSLIEGSFYREYVLDVSLFLTGLGKEKSKEKASIMTLCLISIWLVVTLKGEPIMDKIGIILLHRYSFINTDGIEVRA